MSKYPQVPGHNKVDTSIEAAESMEKSSATLRTRVLKTLKSSQAPGHNKVDTNIYPTFAYPLTSEQISDISGISHDNVWKRISELRAMGKVEDSGERRRNRSGRKAIAWQIRTEEGPDPACRKESKKALREQIDRLNSRIADLNNTINQLVG